MVIDIIRFSTTDTSTLGLLYIDNKYECFTLEDTYNDIKIKHQTRIPAGIYEVGLRKEGGFHHRYSKIYPEFHIGMLELLNVPNFKYILFHPGNTEDDTSGCILVGEGSYKNSEKQFLSNSRLAYKSLYNKIIDVINYEKIYVNIKNIS